MQATSSFIRYFVLIICAFILLIGCEFEGQPVDQSGNSGNIGVEQEANPEEEDIYEVELESINEDSLTPQIEDSDGEYQVDVEIINEDESEADEANEESNSTQERSLDDGESLGEEEGILREGEHVIHVGDQAILAAFADKRSDLLVEASGIVERTLSDDLEGSRHQRFIVSLQNGHSILVAHNIDLSSKIPLQEGDTVDFRGEYEWNEQGGVVHWTHHDPQGKHLDGWIFHNDNFYD